MVSEKVAETEEGGDARAEGNGSPDASSIEDALSDVRAVYGDAASLGSTPVRRHVSVNLHACEAPRRRFQATIVRRVWQTHAIYTPINVQTNIEGVAN